MMQFERESKGIRFTQRSHDELTTNTMFIRCIRQRAFPKLFYICFVLLLSAFFSGLFSVFVYFQYFVRCSEAVGVSQIQKMCYLYNVKEITGSVCSKLCDSNAITYLQCGGNVGDKSVQIIECQGCVEPGVTSKVVLKSDFTMEEWESKNIVPFSNSEPLKVKAEKTFAGVVQRFKDRFQMDMSNQSNLLNLIIGDDYKSIITNNERKHGEDTVFRSVMFLVAQNEFLAMKVYGGAYYMPKLYGTCGPSFLVEHTHPFGNLNYVIFQGKITEIFKLKQRLPSWNERAKIAQKMLSIVRHLESAFDRPIHMCDAAPGNFGVNDKGDVVLLDTGSVRFENTINIKACEVDSECFSGSSCSGLCDERTKMCRKEMISNNLQAICRKVFISGVEKFGLLRNPPISIAGKLRNLLHRCATPMPRPGRLPPENYSDMKMLNKLESLLKCSLSE